MPSSYHGTEAEREDLIAASLERRVSDQERDQTTVAANERHSGAREPWRIAERDRARVAATSPGRSVPRSCNHCARPGVFNG